MANAKGQQIAPTQIQLPQADNPSIGTVTSSFFVAIDDVFTTSNVTSLQNAVQLLWYTSIEERPSIGTMTSDFQASSTLIHSLLEMHILTDSAMPTLRQNLRNNTNIQTITITRVGHLGQGMENTEMYSSTFSGCFIESIEEFPDKLIVKARVTSRSDTAATTSFDGTQSTTSGSTSSGWDYTSNSDAST